MTENCWRCKQKYNYDRTFPKLFFLPEELSRYWLLSELCCPLRLSFDRELEEEVRGLDRFLRPALSWDDILHQRIPNLEYYSSTVGYPKVPKTRDQDRNVILGLLKVEELFLLDCFQRASQNPPFYAFK